MIIHEDKIDEKIMKEYDSNWDKLLEIARANGFIVSSELNGALIVSKNKSTIDALKDNNISDRMAESTFIQKQLNLYGIDLRLKEEVIVYLSDCPNRIKHARKIFLSKKKYNELYYFIDCSDLTNLDPIENLDIDKVIVDMREPMRSIAERLVGIYHGKITDDRNYDLSDSYEEESPED